MSGSTQPPDAATGDDGFAALLRKVSHDSGFACAAYKERCLRRRVGVRMRARGVLRYEDYARLLDEDVGEYERLMRALTINVTKLFRNWEVYDAIARRVIPEIWDRELSAVRVWSAGCAAGQEAFSLAALFHRHAESTGTLDRIASVQVVGTDVDREVLAAARAAEFTQADFADTPPELRARYFQPDPPHSLDPEVRRLVRFVSSDLLSDPPPFSAHELIVCRNVLIYFDRPSQERLFGLFHDALAPDGVLVLGKVETLFGAARARFTALDARERIFRRA